MFVLATYFEFQGDLCEYESGPPSVFVGSTKETVFQEALREWSGRLRPECLATKSTAESDYERAFVAALSKMSKYRADVQGLEVAECLLADAQIYWTLVEV